MQVVVFRNGGRCSEGIAVEPNGGLTQVAIQVVSQSPPYSPLTRLTRAGNDGARLQMVQRSLTLLIAS